MSRRAGGSPDSVRAPLPRSRVASAGIGLAVLAAVGAMLSGLGSRWGLWSFSTGFSVLRWSAYLGIGAGVLSVVGMVRARPGGSRRGVWAAGSGLVLAAVVVIVPWSFLRTAQSVPPIHDITTDTDDPPAFVEILPLRADAPNSAEYAGEEIAQQQREAYPDIGPTYLELPLPTAFERALDAAREMGWEIVAAEPAAGRIEATATTFWYGFEDDVVIRVRSADGRSRVDVRSVSRVGRSDVGKNADRIREYRQILES